MFERFTNAARQVIVHAQEEARDLDHDYIGTEHLLLGLLDTAGTAIHTLAEFGVEADGIRTSVLEIVGRGKDAPSGHIPFTPRAKKVLELALREALELKHNYIGTEHILLGILREGEGVAAQVLTHAGVGMNEARDVVVRLVGDQPESAEEPASPSVFGRLRPRRGGRGEDPQAEIARLRALLQQHGIDPDENVS
jgi:ATP-dependent Clp protease ATP-binding subunit ClpC